MYGQQDRILAIVNWWSTKIKYGLEQCCRQGSKDAYKMEVKENKDASKMVGP